MLSIYVKYIENLKSKTNFLGIIEIDKKDAETIFDAVKELLEINKIFYPHKIRGLGTDGAAVMSGHINGLYGRF